MSWARGTPGVRPGGALEEHPEVAGRRCVVPFELPYMWTLFLSSSVRSFSPWLLPQTFTEHRAGCW